MIRAEKIADGRVSLPARSGRFGFVRPLVPISAATHIVRSTL